MRALLAAAISATLALPAGAAPPAAAAKPTAAPLPPIYDPDMDGERQLEAAARFCMQSGRRLLVNFGTNDCAPCRTVNAAMHETKFYDVLVHDFFPVFIDVTPGSRNVEVLKRLEIDPKRGFPVIAVYDEQLHPADVTRNGEMVELAKKGEHDVQLWLMSHFPKNEER